ncbi:MAG: DNA polymerase I, partial [Actinomycetota bacterium]|nr:DNA polymerase I [Actinomycetota bacterium]
LNIDGLLNKELNEINFNKIEKIFDSLEFKILKERIKKMSVYLDSNKHRENETKGSIQSLAEDLNGNTKEIVKLKFGVVGQDFNVESFINNSNGKLFISLCENCKEKEKSESNSLKNIVIFNGKDDPYVFNTNYLQDENYLKILRILFENENIIKSGIDLKRFYKYLRTYQITMNGKFYDYKIFYLLLNPNKTDASIKEILRTYILENCDNYFFMDSHLPESDFEDKTFLRQDDKKQLANGSENNAQLSFHMEMNAGKNLYEMDQKKNYVKYLAEDDNFKNTLKQILVYPQIEEILLKQIKEQELDNLYECIEGPLIKVLGEMEFTGIAVDKEYLEFLINQYDKDIKILKDDIYKISGDKFNINSPQQLSNILFNKLGLMPARKTKTGLSTDAATLVSLVDESPIIEKILDYREKVKLRNTYIDVLPNLIDPKDNRIHTTYNQLGTTTGRLSSCDPNLQNIPVRTDLGKQIRKAFVPGKGYDLLLSSDYSQIELRILAHLSEDDGLIEVFNKNGDIHTFTASEIFNVSIEDVTEELRRKAKAINFGIIYGMTEYGLKSRLSISEDEAKEYIKLYFSRYPKVKKYINFLIREAYEKGYATTLFGRKRYINELGSTNAKLRNLGERLAVNTPIQGSAADIMKLATVKLFNEIRKNNTDANILLQVHDELVLEIKEDDLDYVKTVVENAMETCVKLKVLLKVEIKSAKNWYI